MHRSVASSTPRVTLRDPTRRRGRLSVPPWVLAAFAIVGGFTLARLWMHRVPRPTSGVDAAPAAPGVPRGLRGELERENARLEAWVLPFGPAEATSDPASFEFARRLGLGEGRLYRVLLREVPKGEGAGDAAPTVRPLDAHVDAGGRPLLRSLRALGIASSGTRDPRVRLLASWTEPVPGEFWQAALWGSLDELHPESASALLLELETPDGVLGIPLRRGAPAPGEVPGWFRRVGEPLSEAGGRVAELERQVAELEERLREQRLAHLKFVEGVAQLEGLAAPRDVEEEAPAPPADAHAAPADPRAEELRLALRAALRLSGHRSLDLLHVGALKDGALGPVLFRILDERGRLSGTLAAERLHMEASRAARTLTIVLEDGYEAHGGVRTPFAGPNGGTRRITMDLEPDDFVGRAPELFRPEDVDPVEDDGVWNLPDVRRALNRLLLADATHGWLRVHSFAGVLGEELVAVHLEEYDASGRLVRRLFADRLTIEPAQGEVRLVLDGGASIRGEERVPFRDGRLVLHLVGADLDAWREAGVPLGRGGAAPVEPAGER